jgi:hypothetical protein
LYPTLTTFLYEAMTQPIFLLIQVARLDQTSAVIMKAWCRLILWSVTFILQLLESIALSLYFDVKKALDFSGAEEFGLCLT